MEDAVKDEGGASKRGTVIGVPVHASLTQGSARRIQGESEREKKGSVVVVGGNVSDKCCTALRAGRRVGACGM